jgi:hypothetical protein
MGHVSRNETSSYQRYSCWKVWLVNDQKIVMNRLSLTSNTACSTLQSRSKDSWSPKRNRQTQDCTYNFQKLRCMNCTRYISIKNINPFANHAKIRYARRFGNCNWRFNQQCVASRCLLNTKFNESTLIALHEVWWRIFIIVLVIKSTVLFSVAVIFDRKWI